LESVDYLNYLDPKDYPDISELMVMMRKWNRSVDKSDENATIFLLTFQYIFDKLHVSNETFGRTLDVSEDLYVEAVRKTKEHLMTYFGRLNVKLGDIQRHVRGTADYPLSGFPDALSANYSQPIEDGKFKPYVADSYVQFVQYKKDGSMVLETLHPFGASSKPDSKHYTDQMEIYANQQTKTMTLNREEIFKNAEKVYHPK
jgi:acyl-homoserine-lactone acylase